jgi:hypothetical protein
MLKNVVFILAIGSLNLACSNTTTVEEVVEKEVVSEEIQQQIDALENFEPTTGGPNIYFPVMEHDMGTIEKNGKIPYTFYFVNSGDAPLLITDAKGSCGCTVPYFPSEPILPGEKGKINLTFDSDRKSDGMSFKVTVTVYTNIKEEPIPLVIKGKMAGEPVE